MADFKDGTSATILAVFAGPETAEVWTKPGGLQLKPDDPKTVLGSITDGLPTLMSDGLVRVISSDIDKETLRRLIQHSDGKPIEEY